LKTRPPIQVIAEVIEASIREDPDHKSDGPIDILHLSKDGARWVQKKKGMPRNPALERNEHRRNFDSTNGLLLIPVVIGLVMLTRWIRGRPVFTDRDWLFLIGRPRGEVFSLHLWFRFATLWLAVVLMGFVEGYVLLPFGLASFFWCRFLTAFVVWRVAPSRYVEPWEADARETELGKGLGGVIAGSLPEIGRQSR
jgi:hypothetical protein